MVVSTIRHQHASNNRQESCFWFAAQFSMAEYSEQSSKKSRKPYTLTKARESWSNDEHERFIKALQLYNRDWKKIETYVGTKTVVQIRSHAQKYFQKILKSGVTDAIPPPRPKRRASDPPQQASCHQHGSDAKHIRLQSDAHSKQGSGRDDDSDEGMHLMHQGHSAGQHTHHQHLHAHSKQPDILEASAQLEGSRAIVSCQGLQHVYLFMASLFTQPHADFGAMLQRLSTRDRHLLGVLLKSLVEELTHQQQQQQSELQQQEQEQCDQHEQHQSGSGANGSADAADPVSAAAAGAGVSGAGAADPAEAAAVASAADPAAVQDGTPRSSAAAVDGVADAAADPAQQAATDPTAVVEAAVAGGAMIDPQLQQHQPAQSMPMPGGGQLAAGDALYSSIAAGAAAAAAFLQGHLQQQHHQQHQQQHNAGLIHQQQPFQAATTVVEGPTSQTQRLQQQLVADHAVLQQQFNAGTHSAEQQATEQQQ